MPDVAGALDQALNKISNELKTNIDAMVRASIEQTLQKQLEPARLTDAAPPVEPAEPQVPAIMPEVSAPAPTPAPDGTRQELRAARDRAHWYPLWESAATFAPRTTVAPAYCIQLPPPNVTGTLHMGHAFQQTMMDALIRYHRMRGYNTNWVVGTDHAGIATQIVVERQLEAQGKTRHDLGREQFVERVWEWKQESGSTITRQMRRLGASANWTMRTPKASAAAISRWTTGMSRAVVEVFVRLHEEGLIYRGKRLVNWDPVLGTAVSDLEVDSEEEDGKIWEITLSARRWRGAARRRDDAPGNDARRRGGRGATRRRALQHLIGKRVQLPLTGRTIPVIADDYVDPRVRHRLRQDHARARFQRLPGRPASRACADQYPDARCARSTTTRRQRIAGSIVSKRGKRGAGGSDRRRDCWRRKRPHKLKVPRSRPHRRHRRADADRPVVRADGRLWRSAGLARRRRRATSSSFPSTGPPRTTNGSKTSRTGASRASSGGATRFPRGTTTAATSMSARSEDEARAQAAAKVMTARYAATTTCSTPGSPRRCVPFTSLGWPEADPGPRAVPAVVGAGHRLRHHLLLGRAHDHDDPALHRQGAVPRRLHSRPRARCRRPEDVEVEGQHARPARLDRRHHARRAGREIARSASCSPSTARRSRNASARIIRMAFLRSAPTRCASPSPRWPRSARTINFDLEPLRRLSQLLQQAVECDALRADELRGQGRAGSTKRCRSNCLRPIDGS